MFSVDGNHPVWAKQNLDSLKDAFEQFIGQLGGRRAVATFCPDCYNEILVALPPLDMMASYHGHWDSQSPMPCENRTQAPSELRLSLLLNRLTDMRCSSEAQFSIHFVHIASEGQASFTSLTEMGRALVLLIIYIHKPDCGFSTFSFALPRSSTEHQPHPVCHILCRPLAFFKLVACNCPSNLITDQIDLICYIHHHSFEHAVFLGIWYPTAIIGTLPPPSAFG